MTHTLKPKIGQEIRRRWFVGHDPASGSDKGVYLTLQSLGEGRIRVVSIIRTK